MRSRITVVSRLDRPNFMVWLAHVDVLGVVGGLTGGGIRGRSASAQDVYLVVPVSVDPTLNVA